MRRWFSSLRAALDARRARGLPSGWLPSHGLPGPRREDDVVPDPFTVLRLQVRLGVLADEVRALEADDQVFAKAHRLTAVRGAYDDLLQEACRLAGVPPAPADPRREEQRMRAEVELAGRGWSW